MLGANSFFMYVQGLSLNFCTDIHQGVGWLVVGKRYYFSLHKNFRTADPFPGTNFSQLWRDFFWRKITRGCVRRIVDDFFLMLLVLLRKK